MMRHCCFASQYQRRPYQVDGLRVLLGRIVAPRLAPKPLLRQTFDGHLVDHVVRQVLIQIGQAVGILTQGLVLPPQSVPSGDSPETFEIHNVKRADVVPSSLKMVFPVTLIPEPEGEQKLSNVSSGRVYRTIKLLPEAVHLLAAVTEGRVSVRRTA